MPTSFAPRAEAGTPRARAVMVRAAPCLRSAGIEVRVHVQDRERAMREAERPSENDQQPRERAASAAEKRSDRDVERVVRAQIDPRDADGGRENERDRTEARPLAGEGHRDCEGGRGMAAGK